MLFRRKCLFSVFRPQTSRQSSVTTPLRKIEQSKLVTSSSLGTSNSSQNVSMGIAFRDRKNVRSSHDSDGVRTSNSFDLSMEKEENLGKGSRLHPSVSTAPTAVVAKKSRAVGVVGKNSNSAVKGSSHVYEKNFIEKNFIEKNKSNMKTAERQIIGTKITHLKKK